MAEPNGAAVPSNEGLAGFSVHIGTVAWSWHVVFAAAAALVAVSATSTATTDVARAAGVLGTIALVGGYLRFGIPAMQGGRGTTRYAACAVVGVVLLSVSSDAPVLIVGVIGAQLYWATSVRRATPWVAMLFAIVALGSAWHRGFEAQSSGLVFVLAAGGFVLSWLVASSLGRVLEQNERRAALIVELEESRQELETLHHDLGVLEERARMAGEIHDSLAQGFASIHLLLSSVERDLSRGHNERAVERVKLARQQAALQVQESRAIVAALAPVDLEAGSLGRSIRAVCDRFAREAGIQLHTDVADLELAEVQRVAILRTVQECLSNIRKHAEASTVSVHLRESAWGSPRGADAERSPSGVELVVSDDGRGFDQEQVASAGFGLEGVRRRIERLGGHLDVRSAADAGATIRAWLPSPTAMPSPEGTR